MASIRRQILQQLRDRLATIPTWSVQLLDEIKRASRPVAAVIYTIGTNQELAHATAYNVTMAVGVEITGQVADADDELDGGNRYAYLDRLVALAEAKLHTPDSWGPNPAFTDLRIDGHDIVGAIEGAEQAEVEALLRLTVTFRQSITDPEASE